MSGTRHREMINLNAWPVHVQKYVDAQYLARGFEIMDASAPDRFASLTSETVREALDGFRLSRPAERNVDWLARALRKVLALATPLGIAHGDNAQPNSITRAKLTRAAANLDKAASTMRELSELDLAPVVQVMAITPHGPPSFRSMPAELEYISDIFRQVARSLHVVQGPARAAAARELVVRRAFYLAPLFEMVFGVKATVNDFPGADLGPWPDFFARIMFAATGDRVADLRKIAKEARSRHLARQGGPLTYPEKWLDA